jgi:uncharacterized protein (DUF885 family)
MVPDPDLGRAVMPHLTRRRFTAGLLFSAGAALALPGSAAAETASEDARLMALLRDDARRVDALEPMAPIYRGTAPSPAAFRLLFTDQHLRALRASAAQSLKALERIDRARLSAERQISYDAFRYDKREDALWLRPDMIALTAVRPFNHFMGLHIEFPSLIALGGALRYDSESDYRRNLALLESFAQVLDNATARFRQGLASGVVETRLTTINMIAQIDALLAQSLAESPMTSAVREFPAGLPAGGRDDLRRGFESAVANGVYPAYRRLRDFLRDEYLPEAREAVGLSAMKGGAGLYGHLIARHTTLRLDPEAVHTLGLSEVARIQREMDAVKQRLGFKGSLRAFFDEVRSNPRYHPKSREELAKAFADTAQAVDAQIPRFFRKVPRTKLAIEPYPAFREKFDAGGSYYQGSPDGQRPGVFSYNTYDLPSRFLTGVVTLYLHEGVPGHHFQISLAQENAALPDFQRHDGNTAFVEGWALYAETLGYEMGFYKDPMAHWGTLDDEMLRAMRLVVDTGLHAKGWSRDMAIDYMLANSGMGRSDATAEVERYIVWPGQALSYKIGALTIQRLRREAEGKLGSRFDIKAFHEQVLGSGALPMPVLEAKIGRWIAGVAAGLTE